MHICGYIRTSHTYVHFSIMHTVEPAKSGHVWDQPFVLYKRLSSLRRLKYTSIIEKRPQSGSFIERFFLPCPLLGVSVIRGSTVVVCSTACM